MICFAADVTKETQLEQDVRMLKLIDFEATNIDKLHTQFKEIRKQFSAIAKVSLKLHSPFVPLILVGTNVSHMVPSSYMVPAPYMVPLQLIWYHISRTGTIYGATRTRGHC